MFRALPLWANVAIFLGSAATVWFAGTRLARYADAIARKTGLGREILGVLLLGSMTSIPGLAVATTASLAGTPALSVNDVLGSAAVNVLILALADAALGRGALTSTLGSPGVLLQGVLGIILLSLVVAATLTGDIVVLGIGAWSWLMLAVYIGSVLVITRSQGRPSWVPAGGAPPHERPRAPQQGSLRQLTAGTAAAGAAILAAGFLLARTGDALAEQTGLGASFVGAVFLAVSTSLPEVSSTLAAVRLKQYEMAISGVFGTNL